MVVEGLKIMSTSIFANTKFMEEWLEASSKTIKEEPRNKVALDIHIGLHEAHGLYLPENKLKDFDALPINKRPEIFARFERSACSGDQFASRAMFFEGLSRREGFGCKKDITTGNALIQV